MKRWQGLAAVAGAAALAFAVCAGWLAMDFVGLAPLEDGRALGPLTTVKDGYVASFLGEAPDGSLFLVDAGQDADGTPLRAALAARGRSADDVRAVFLTHGHGDHVGGCAAFPQATVYALAGEVPLITGASAAHGPVTRWVRNDGRCAVDHALSDGETVDVGGTSVTVYAIPGHTAGSVAYLVEGVLLFGDAASATAGGAVRGPPWVFSDDVDQAHDSLVALASRVPVDVRWMGFAHTGPIEGTAALKALKPR